MYLHLGQSVVVPHRSILGIFDLDNCSWSHLTRDYLQRAEKAGGVVSVCEDIPRSFVVCRQEDGSTTVYISQLSATTLRGRWESNSFE